MMRYDGKTIEELQNWIKDNPVAIDGVLERYRIIKEMKNEPYQHYYGYNRPLD